MTNSKIVNFVGSLVWFVIAYIVIKAMVRLTWLYMPIVLDKFV